MIVQIVREAALMENLDLIDAFISDIFPVGGNWLGCAAQRHRFFPVIFYSSEEAVVAFVMLQQIGACSSRAIVAVQIWDI